MTERPIDVGNAEWRQRATLSIPEYAKIVGVGKNTAYAAANSGEIPIIKLQGRKLVPVPWLLRQLEGASINAPCNAVS
jgi:excisionase family DNA binding protein